VSNEVEPLVRCKDLKVSRGAFSLHVPEWEVPAGRVVGVVGPNGAGKTTLLQTLPGLLPLTSGTLRVLGHDPIAAPVAVRSRLGFMSAEMPVFDLRVGALLRHISGYYSTWDAGLAQTLIERFALDLDKRTRDLSRGQGTRLRLLTAFAFRPALLVLDEPTAGLDLEGRHALMECVLEVVADPTRSVIVCSHQLADVARMADHLLVIEGGRVVRSGETDDLVGEERTLEEAVRSWGASG
jgi:ABC-2 type transport system ATP-binding protein